MSENYVEFDYNYASFKLVPYGKDKSSSSHLLRNIIQALNSEVFSGEKKIIDRHLNRKNTPSRKLVFISGKLEKEGRRFIGKIALIKNKDPMVWGGKDIIEEITKEKNKKFIDVTNFIINFNDDSDPIIMHEFNYEGPRLSDIEYYFRQVSTELRIAKYVNATLHLDSEYDNLEKDMSNIFELKVKVNAGHTNKLDWHNDLKQLNDSTGFSDVRLELFFQRKKENGTYKKNILGLDFSRKMINWLRKDKNNIEYIDDLKMKYQVGDDEEIIDLDFLKNKSTSFFRMEVFDGLYNKKELIKQVSNEFSYYLTTGKTHNEVE